jgi:Spy/CpxP family protein refolding chaperone
MKQLSLAALALSAMFTLAIPSAVCSAQSQSTPSSTPTTPPASAGTSGKQPRPKREIKRLTTQLSLTDDQQTKVRTIIEAQDQQIDQVQADTTLSDTQKKEKIASIRQSSRKQIEPLLTDTQKQQYAQMKGNHRATSSEAGSQ